MEISTKSAGTTKSNILKSTAIIGSSSFVNVALSIIRTKLLAVLLGPSGMGLFGLFNGLMTTIGGFSTLGLNQSGVRNLAAARATQQTDRVTVTRRALRFALVCLGILGAVATVLFAETLSQNVFGDTAHVSEMWFVAVGVLFTTLAAEPQAVLNGYREIKTLAALSVWSGIFTTAFGLLVIFFFREKGIIYLVIGTPLVSLFVGKWFCFKKIEPLENNTTQPLFEEIKSLISVGAAFTITATLAGLVLIFVRTILLKNGGEASVGLFQAVWSISTMYIGFILSAMGTDFYPNLTAHIKDTPLSNRLVNEQAEVALVLATPVILAFLAFLPYITNLLYAPEFEAMNNALQWQILGTVIKIAAWCIGFIILAKGLGKLFIFTELVWNLLFGGIIYIGVEKWGFDITGYAFFGAHLLYFLMLTFIVFKINHFVWQKTNLTRFLLLLTASSTIVAVRTLLNPHLAVAFGAILTLIFGFFSLKWLIAHVPKFQNLFNKIKGKF